MHTILSVISFENSLAMSYMQSSDNDLINFRKKYIENSNRIHEALAIAALYYPDMVEPIRSIFTETNFFGGNKEKIFLIDKVKNKSAWDTATESINQRSHKIAEDTKNLQNKIVEKGLELKKRAT